MGCTAADAAGVCQYRSERQPQALEDCRVGGMHYVVRFAKRVGACVEGVGVLHEELARPHDAEPRTYLVTHLGLDLVKIQRELAIAADFVPDQVGHHLLVRGAKTEIAIVSVPDSQQLRTILLPAPRLLPQLRRLDHRHADFLGAGAVHFLANNGFYLAQYPESKRKPGVKPG